MLLRLATRNLLRNRQRTSIALVAIAFGIASLILSGGFVHDLLFQLGEQLIRSQSGHLQVGRPAYFAEGSRSPEKHRVGNSEAIKKDLAGLEGVSQTMARLAFSGLLNNGRVDVPIVGEGIEPTREGVLSSALQMQAGRALTESDLNGAVLGEGLARSLGVGPGDLVTLLVSTFDGAMNTAEFEIVGVFRSFSRDYDQRVIKIALPSAQQLFGAPDASVVVVLLDRTEDTGTVLAKARRLTNGTDLVVKRWEEVNDFYANTVALYERQFAVLKVIILAMIVLGVANAVNMSVFERTAEFGTMRALGNRGRFVVGLVLTECLLLGLAGAAVGVLIGASLAAAISIIGIPMPPPPNSNVGYTARIMLQPAAVAQAFVIGAAATFLSGVVPAVRARRVAIVDALRAAI